MSTSRALALALLTVFLAACGGHYYKVTDPGSSKAFYTEEIKRNGSAIEFKDAQTGGVENLQDIQILSDLADQYGCGNCGELTAVTFIYLYNLSIRPLDFMALKPPADHAFVVIGRSGSDTDDSFGRNWDSNAVICDPWASELKAFFPGRPLRPDTFRRHLRCLLRSVFGTE
jgi:uncharacterized protein YkvS